MYYSLLQRHNNGSWWYHGETFDMIADAAQVYQRREEMHASLGYADIWMLVSHKGQFPPRPEGFGAWVTMDGKTFYHPADSRQEFELPVKPIFW